MRTRSEPVPLLLKASSALPVLYNRRIVLDGREYVDGGVSDSLPIARAIDNGCTDILVLASRRCDSPEARPNLGEQSLFYMMMGRRYPALMRAFASMHEALNRSRRLATGEEAVGGVNIALIAPCEGDSMVGEHGDRTRPPGPGCPPDGDANLRALRGRARHSGLAVRDLSRAAPALSPRGGASR